MVSLAQDASLSDLVGRRTQRFGLDAFQLAEHIHSLVDSSEDGMLAIEVNGWNERHQTASVYWVDAQWTLPTPAVSGYGGHTLITNVARSTTGQPVAGWIVRYQILGGTPAALDANGAQVIEVPTDAAGNAAVAVIPQSGGQGTTNIGVQVIRPGIGSDPGRGLGW